jgi:hypothetical protein
VPDRGGGDELIGETVGFGESRDVVGLVLEQKFVAEPSVRRIEELADHCASPFVDFRSAKVCTGVIVTFAGAKDSHVGVGGTG